MLWPLLHHPQQLGQQPVLTCWGPDHTAVFIMDNQQGPTVEHWELCSVLCVSLDGKGCGGKWMHVYVCLCIPTSVFLSFPCGSAGKESTCNGRRPGFDPWVGKILWRRERLPNPVFWPGEFHGLYNPWCHKDSDMTEWLSLTYTYTCIWSYLEFLGSSDGKEPACTVGDLGSIPG